MTSPYSALAQLSDDQLLAEVTRLAAHERQATAGLVASLVVLDARRLYLREGYPSLFAYSTGALGLSEGGAYLRIEAARAVRRLPLLLDRLASGAITLTGIKLLAPHLTDENHLAVLETARGKNTREIEQLAAQLRPLPDVPAVIRKVPARQVASISPAPSSPSARTQPAPQIAAAANDAPPGARCPTEPALDLVPPALAGTAVPSPRAVVAPLAPERYKLQMTIGTETHERLCRARSLLRHAIPDGDLAAIFDRALVLLLEQLERQKWGARKARRETPTGDPAKSTNADAEARKERRRARKGGDESSGVTVGATQPRRSVRQAGPSAGPGADARELVAKRVRVANGHAVEQQPDPALSESKTGPPACPALTLGEQAASPVAAATELVAKRVRPGDGEVASAPLREAPAGPKTAKARPRRIPAAVRRAVWLGANGQCTYVSAGGQRCGATSSLEFHHVVPYADGGEPTVDGIRLLCRAHHSRETERWFGERLIRGGNLLGP